MPKIARELTEDEVRELRTPQDRLVGGVPGLTLQVNDGGTKSWILRITIDGQRKELGLGPYPAVDLGTARRRAAEIRASHSNQRSSLLAVAPVEFNADAPPGTESTNMERRESVHPPAPALSPTFKECADRYIWEHENQWTNKKHAQQWRNTLGTYVYPVIGDVAVRDVSLDQVLFILRTGWLEKAETFRRVRNRMELILDWASKKKLRTGENPARWRANLDQYLARQERSSRSSHAHLPPDQLPELMKTLHRMPGISPLCVSFIALTLCKTRQARFATLDEIDFANKIWTIPYERNYQSERSWELQLSDEAMRVLMKTRECTRDQNNVLLFPAPRGGELSDGLSAVFKRINMKVTADGFRTTFRKWCQQSNRCSDLVINEALGFKRSKKHSDDADKDLKINVRRLLEEWGAFCMSEIAEEKTETTWRRPVCQKFERVTDETSSDRHTC